MDVPNYHSRVQNNVDVVLAFLACTSIALQKTIINLQYTRMFLTCRLLRCVDSSGKWQFVLSNNLSNISVWCPCSHCVIDITSLCIDNRVNRLYCGFDKTKLVSCILNCCQRK